MCARYTLSGVQDVLEIFEDKIIITPKGVLGVLNKGLTGKKEIPFSSIMAIQHKEAGWAFNGYLQFSILGGRESKGGIFAATQDENSFMFTTKLNSDVLRVKKYIEEQIKEIKKPINTLPLVSLSDELVKMKDLFEKGILSESEYLQAKAKLLN